MGRPAPTFFYDLIHTTPIKLAVFSSYSECPVIKIFDIDDDSCDIFDEATIYMKSLVEGRVDFRKEQKKIIHLLTKDGHINYDYKY